MMYTYSTEADMSNFTRFIVIDDDPLNNTICKLSIKKALGSNVEIVTFTDPKVGFDYISNEFARQEEAAPAILFLDLNMPIMTGWEFLEHYEQLAAIIKQRIRIHILSSSVNERDIEKANANKNVVNYIPKPITKEAIVTIASLN